jgi:PhnB protein
MLADEYPEIDFRSPRSIGGSPVLLHVYVEDVDDVFDRALSAGATERRPVEDQFYGERSGQFEDPWGHLWHVSTRIEVVPPDEMARRSAERAQ